MALVGDGAMVRRWALITAWAITAGIIIATLLALAVVRPVFTMAIMFTPAFDVYATGDSMANYINGGDTVGIDISDITPKDGEVYALFLDGDLMIKRIFKEAGGVIRLSSDNKQYTDKIVTQDNGDSLIIIGRVVYRSG